MITGRMYIALLRQQFVLQRAEVITLTVAGGAIVPMAFRAVQSIGIPNSAETLLTMGVPLAIFAIIFSAVTGLLLAMRSYATDAQTRHTYALALPITRGGYATLRALTGLTFAALPVTAFGLGTFLTVAAVPLSPELFAYPWGITLRCALAVLVAYAFAFALQYGLGRHAGRILLLFMLLVAAAEITSQMVFRGLLTADLWAALASDLSPFAVFNSGWMLFDV